MESNFSNSDKVFSQELVETLRKRSFRKGFKKGYDKGYSKALDDVISSSLEMKIKDTTTKVSPFSKATQTKIVNTPLITTVIPSADDYISENTSE